VTLTGERELYEMLIKCAATTLSSKLVSNDREHFAKMVVDAVNYLDIDMPLNMIGIKKVNGGSITVMTDFFLLNYNL
jgi:T-complex protein 1 subunit eta